MLDLQFIRDNQDRVRKAMVDKGIGNDSIVDALLKADEERRNLITQTQDTQDPCQCGGKGDWDSDERWAQRGRHRRPLSKIAD